MSYAPDPAVLRAQIRQVVPPPAGDPRLGERPSSDTWARPFVFRPASELPHRQWLYGDHYIRRFLTTTLAPGGVGKSALALVEALSMASGKALVGVVPVERCKVWYWNGEDPYEETERRVAALCLHYGLGAADLEGWLFLGSGRDGDLVIAEQSGSDTTVNAPVVDELLEMIDGRDIDVAIIDPFVSSHSVSENDNGAIDRVAKTWARIADRTAVSVELIHHMRKRPTGNGEAEMTVEDGRGAVALLAAARSARVLNPMSKQEAENAGVEKRRSFFRVDNGKANLAPPPEGSTWFRFVSENLGNGGPKGGDSVGVVTAWEWPDHAKGLTPEMTQAVQRLVASKDGADRYRKDVQSAAWVGNAVAQVLALDLHGTQDKAKAKELLRGWGKAGLLVDVRGKDAKSKDVTFVEVGKWIDTSVEVAA